VKITITVSPCIIMAIIVRCSWLIVAHARTGWSAPKYFIQNDKRIKGCSKFGEDKFIIKVTLIVHRHRIRDRQADTKTESKTICPVLCYALHWREKIIKRWYYAPLICSRLMAFFWFIDWLFSSTLTLRRYNSGQYHLFLLFCCIQSVNHCTSPLTRLVFDIHMT